MNAVDLFVSDELELPKSWDSGSASFDAHLSDVFGSFLSTFKNVDASDFVSKQVRSSYPIAEKLCKRIKEVIEFQFQGSPSKAFEELKTAIAEVDPYIQELLSSPDISTGASHLYRMRIGESNQMSRKEMFHIPFELRHLVATQRYSIPGLPCLYLGGSTYLCWEELSRPPLHTIHVARFKPVDGMKLRVLDLGYRPAEIAAYLDHEKAKMADDNPESRFVIAQGVCWPLLAACSIRVRFKSAPFKPEYVLPQLLLQWVSGSTDCDGIRFFSTRIKDYFGFPMPGSNFAFPSRTVTPTGFCKTLASKFELTEPLYWQLAKGSGLPSMQPPNMHFKLRLADGAEGDYINTEFGMMQFVLTPLPCKGI